MPFYACVTDFCYIWHRLDNGLSCINSSQGSVMVFHSDREHALVDYDECSEVIITVVMSKQDIYATLPRLAAGV